MAILPGTATDAQVLGNTVNALIGLRKAYERIEELHSFTAGVAVADLTGLGLDPGTAQGILNALADAHGEYMIRTTGSDPRNPGAGYIYAASQNQLIGPQL